ncbi:FAD-dependent oxidoreductase [Actinoplanes sp. TRM 88003]|uniref:FAD-dependent oxidoreductase n=1 Tax=Paractinoplanes aksuensis TaxID=2939490 RepID=A0ABT1E373_9ACTN|nr:FAD-dependent oxidoreductase [Actinoplanes aksuensis]MCO8277553.1 FAD-dependent oxidoreductase [Actinoplanes aksuensis]
MLDIIRPGDPAYRSVRHVYTATGSPAAVVRPRSADEVAAALGFARESGGPLAVRSGGHGISSVATNDGGTVIDLSRLDAVEPLQDNLVRIEPGARWGDVAAELSPLGLAISSGDSGDVGVGGLATTGGLGLLGRAHGLTIDRLTSAELVTADGTIRTVDAEHEPELFWAIRGAGANIGVVTSFTFRAARVPVVAHATFQYRVPDVASFLRRWGETVEAAPRTVSAFLYLLGDGVALATVVVTDADAEPALTPFLRVAPLLGRHVQLTPYASVVTATHAPQTGQQRARTHSGLAVHLDEPVAGRIADLVDAGFGQLLQIRSAGGAINDVPPDATAYAHRHQNFSITAVAAPGRTDFDAAFDKLRPALDGLYLSFESTFTPQRLLEAFPPTTRQRLRAVKAAVDPDDLFHQNFPVSAH